MCKRTNNRTVFNLIYYILSMLCLLAVYLCIDSDLSFDKWISLVGIIICFHSTISIFVMRSNDYEFYSLSMLFLLLLFLFYWGQIFILTFINDYSFHAGGDMLRRYPQLYYQKSCLYVLIFITLYVCGTVSNLHITHSSKKQPLNCATDWSSTKNSTIRRIAIIILIITIPPNLFEMIRLITLSQRGGYLATFNSGVSGLVSSIGNISVLGFVLLMYGAPKKRKQVFCLSCVYYIISMFSGNRSPAVCACVTLWCYYESMNERKKRSIGKTVIVIVLGLFALSALGTIMRFRDYTAKSLGLFFELYRRDLRNNAFLRAVEEFGSTIADVSIVQMYLNESGKYLYGWSYISGLFTVFPNVGGVIAPITESGNFGRIVQTAGIAGGYVDIGGSVVAESIINFGNYFFVVPILIGVYFKHISLSIRNEDPIIAGKVAMVVYTGLFWIRGYFGPAVRDVVWSWLLLYAVKRLLIRSRNYRLPACE